MCSGRVRSSYSTGCTRCVTLMVIDFASFYDFLFDSERVPTLWYVLLSQKGCCHFVGILQTNIYH
jgi:hypothetical protein